MLDKIPPNEIKSIVKELKKQDLHDYVLLEASGNINENNLLQYKNCGIDVISMGCITNSAKVLNMSMEIK
jgi:nicotinate-nucleotide pyrophosphorylase (carboxylating)